MILKFNKKINEANKINLVGQPIFNQIIKMIPRDKFDQLVRKFESDKYYKSFFSLEKGEFGVYKVEHIRIQYKETFHEYTK